MLFQLKVLQRRIKCVGNRYISVYNTDWVRIRNYFFWK